MHIKKCPGCGKVFVGGMWSNMGHPPDVKTVSSSCPNCAFDNLDDMHAEIRDILIHQENLFVADAVRETGPRGL